LAAPHEELVLQLRSLEKTAGCRIFSHESVIKALLNLFTALDTHHRGPN
jgi:hypothetical protein